MSLLRKTSFTLSRSILILISIVLAPVVQSATYSPYAISTLSYEDNLFRVSSDAEALSILNDDDPSDTIFQLGAGIEGELDISRQSISYDAHLYRSTYSNFSKLNHNAGAAKVQADYEIGNLWFGNVSYKLARELSNFDQFQQFRKSIKTRNTLTADLYRKLTTRLNALVGLGYRTVEFDGRGTEGEESNRWVANLYSGLEYTTPLNNTIGLRINTGRTRFPNRNLLFTDDQIDKQYDELGADVFVNWLLTPQSQIKGSFGGLKRDQRNFSSGDFNGLIGNMQYIWKPRSKFTLKTTFSRDLSSLQGEATSYVVLDAIYIEPTWSLTNKVKIYLRYGHEERDYRGIDDIDGEKDTVKEYKLGIDYQPRRFMDMEIYYASGDRNSSNDINDYDFGLIVAAVKFNFR